MGEARIGCPTRTPSRTQARRLADKYISWILDETNDRGHLDDDTWEDIAQRIEDDLQGREFDVER